MALENTSWRLASLPGDALAVDLSRVSLVFTQQDDGTLRVAGAGGCNRYSGPCTITDDTLAVGQLATTRMMCSPILSELETRYLRALTAARRYILDGGGLTIETDEGTLRFTAAND